MTDQDDKSNKYNKQYLKYRCYYLNSKFNKEPIKIGSKMITLVRHGETEWNVFGLGQGAEADISLNDKGREQAHKTGLYLRNYRMTKYGPFDCIISSPMMRTTQTAEIIKEIINFDGDIQFLDELKERRQGKLSGKSKTDALYIKMIDYTQKYMPIDPIDRYNVENIVFKKLNDEDDVGYEMDYDLENRAEFAINKIISMNGCKNILVISHGGLMWAMMRKIFRIPIVPIGDIKNGTNCWISYITYDDTKGFKMISPMDTAHLSLKFKKV